MASFVPYFESQSTRTVQFLYAISLTLMLVACGAGGGDSSSDGGGNAVGDNSAGGVSLGGRAVPGYTVQAARMSAAIAGQPLTIRITVTPDAGQPLPTSVEGWAGGEFDASASPITATPVPGLPGVYEVVIPVPDPLPAGWAAWTRLRIVDGSVLELGRDDFQLSTTP